MKRFVALVLALCMLLPLIACGTQPTETETPAPAEVSAEQTQQEGYTEEQYQQAAVAVALGYYYKNPYMQYDARNLSSMGKWKGPMRNNHGAPPEYASADQDHFSQCTDFVMDVYIQAYDYHMYNDIMQPHTDNDAEIGSMDPKDPCVVFYWTPESEMSVNEMAKKVVEILQPGDMLASNGRDTGESVGSGHAMLCVGDVDGDGEKDMIHCWGKPLAYNSTLTGPRFDYVEPNGSIFLQSAKDLLISSDKAYEGAPKWNIRSDAHVKSYLLIVRPTLAADFTNTITKGALCRMQYEGIEIDRRTVGMTKYNDLLTGQELTFEVEITNNGKAAYTALPVSEVIPEGVTLNAASVTDGGKADGNTVAWTVDVPAGESKVLSYTVTVDAPRGTLIEFPSGAVADIETRSITMQVGGKHLTEEQLVSMRSIAESANGTDGQPAQPNQMLFGFSGKDSTDLTFVSKFYKNVLGIELELPADLNEYLDLAFTRDMDPEGNNVLIPSEKFAADHPELAAMQMYKHLGGLNVYMNEGLSNEKRLLELKEAYYQPGDIFLTTWGANGIRANNPQYAGIYLYLGDGKVLTPDAEGKLIVDAYGNTMNCLLRDNFFVVLRPTLAYDDINAK